MPIHKQLSWHRPSHAPSEPGPAMTPPVQWQPSSCGPARLETSNRCSVACGVCRAQASEGRPDKAFVITLQMSFLWSCCSHYSHDPLREMRRNCVQQCDSFNPRRSDPGFQQVRQKSLSMCTQTPCPCPMNSAQRCQQAN